VSTILLQFTPQFDLPDVVIAPNESLTVQQNSSANNIAPVITDNGVPVTPNNLTIVTQPAHGDVSVSGASLLYTPATGYYGPDSFTYKATVSGTDSNVAAVSVNVLSLACQELGRVTRSFVSGYTAARAESRRVRRFSQRCVTANFNGALAPGRTIVHVRWDTTSPWSILMANPRIIAGQRQVAIDVSFNFAGWGGLLATVTLDNGELYNQEFFYTVMDRPIYPGAVYNSANGPFTLESNV
jgi:hypothetical protein